MTAGVYNFTLEQGVTFRRQVTIYDANNDPVDLTDFTARMQIRPEVESDTVIVYLTSANGGLTLGASAGTIDILINDTETSSVTTDGVYDIEIISGDTGDVTRVLKGKVRLDPEVTR